MFLYNTILLIYINIYMSEGKLATRSYLDTVDPESVGLQFVVEVDSPGEDVVAELTPDVCCLVLDDGVDCGVMNAVGGCYHIIPKGTKTVMKLIAPLMDPFDRRGHCLFYLDSRPADRTRGTTRDVIKVHFDTRRTNSMTGLEDGKSCPGIDEDPLNSCKPVDCETYYNGKRSHFDKRKRRCVAIPNCTANLHTELSVYNPVTNRCVENQSISQEDLEFIKSLKDSDRKAKEVLIIKNMRRTTKVYNITAGVGDVIPAANLHYGVTEKATFGHQSKVFIDSLRKYFVTNRYTLIVLCLVIVAQCCLICTMVYCITQCTCCGNKKVVSKYFNYKQDASVTTPLIYTSNIDTETTEANFTSESSNVDKRIKCYKACQRDTAKYSLSDDILSKCLNRRKWDRIPKSTTIPEFNENRCEYARVNFEDEIRDAKEAKFKEVKYRDEELKYKRSIQGVQCDLSEKEIKCHTYNLQSGRQNLDAKTKGTTSISTEKGAQAQFSNDSIDDFLSERGVLFLAGENSFESSSGCTKSSISSKTSKNNVLKNVLSLLSRRSKPSSVPRRQRSKEGLDLELIHMSCASDFTSSNGSKGGKKKDSRTSL